MTPYLADIPSPPQGVWTVGPLPIRAYALFIIVGIVVGVWWGNRRFVARGGRPGRVTDIAVFCVPFGLVGGRIYHVATDPELYFGPGRNPWNAFAIWNGGLGIWGAIALGGVGALIGCRRYKVPFTSFADAVAPGVVLAQAIGRLGNYFNQELYGSRTGLPWALDVYLRTPGGTAGSSGDCFDLTSGAQLEFPTAYIKATPEVLCGTYHPTFLYELLWNVLVAVAIVWADRRFRLGGGRVFGLYVAGYTLGRGWIEMLRIDTANHFLGVRINVFTSILVFAGALVFLFIRRNAVREDPALVHGPPSDPGATGGSTQSDSANGAGGDVGADTNPAEPPDGEAGAGEQSEMPLAEPAGRTVAEPAGRTVAEPAGRTVAEPAGRTVENVSVAAGSDPGPPISGRTDVNEPAIDGSHRPATTDPS